MFVTKFDRHGYKPRDRFLVVTNSAVYLLDAKDCKAKHRLAFGDVIDITVTTGKDNLVLVRLPESAKKDKGDLILECRFLIETLTWIVDTCKNRNIVRFESATSYNIPSPSIHFDSVLSQLNRVALSFSLTHFIAKKKPGVIEITQAAGVTGIAKGKNGRLIVVSFIPYFTMSTIFEKYLNEFKF